MCDTWQLLHVEYVAALGFVFRFHRYHILKYCRRYLLVFSFTAVKCHELTLDAYVTVEGFDTYKDFYIKYKFHHYKVVIATFLLPRTHIKQ